MFGIAAESPGLFRSIRILFLAELSYRSSGSLSWLSACQTGGRGELLKTGLGRLVASLRRGGLLLVKGRLRYVSRLKVRWVNPTHSGAGAADS